jgi:hypothetical protein
MLTRETLQGFSLIGLASEHCSVAVLPELGSKIFSLVNLRTGREWMWHPPGPLQLWQNAEGESFLKSTFIGADECLPTIAPCTWHGRALPDHGEVWSARWTLDEQALTENTIRTTVQLPRSPFFFERSITLDQKIIRLDYGLRNTGTEAESWLWALHPLLSFQEDDRLELPSEVQRMRVYVARQPDFPSGTLLDWPGNSPEIALPELRLAGNDSYLKAFTGSLREGRARIANPGTNDSLEFRWNTNANPFLGLWLTRGGFNGWHHPAIEPTNLDNDSLAEAACSGSVPTLEPGARHQWTVEIEVG